MGLPGLQARRDILKTRLRSIRLTASAGEEEVWRTLERLLVEPQAEYMTGADWKGVVDTAFLLASAQYARALKTMQQPSEGVVTSTTAATRTLNDNFPLSSAHFLEAFSQVKPSLSEKELRFYRDINSKFIPASNDSSSTGSGVPKIPQKQCFA